MGCILPMIHCRSQHCWIRLHTTANTDAITPNIVGLAILGVVASVSTQRQDNGQHQMILDPISRELIAFYFQVTTLYQVVAYNRLKCRKIIKIVVVLAYGRWSFLGGSNCKALTGKSLVFWITQWSHMRGGSTWVLL